MYRQAGVAVLAFAIGLSGVSSANAGLLDFIFGWRNRTDIPKAAAPAPTVNVTISPRPKQHKVARAKPRAPKTPSVVQLSPKDMLARTMDPAKNPNWWLEDPTLRKGDILVLIDRVLVFNGGPLGAPKSYAALSKSKLLNARERMQVAAMTGHSYDPPMLADAIGPRQPKLLKSASLGVPALPPMLGAPRG